MSTALPADIIVQSTGPILVGHLLNWGLFGVLSVQVYIYYLSFPKDNLLNKVIVCVIYVLEVLQTVLATRDAFRTLGSGWGNLFELDSIGLLWFSIPVLGSLISGIAQLFYARRIWIVSQQIWLPLFVTLLALMQVAAGLDCGAESFIIGMFSKLQQATYTQTLVWLGGTAVCDIVIAGSMLYYLSISRTEFRTTNTLIERLIRITVETGLVTASFAIMDLALFHAFLHNNYHFAVSITLSKLYSNSLLTMVNSRMVFSGGRLGAPHSERSAIIVSTSVTTTNDRGEQNLQSHKHIPVELLPVLSHV